MSGSTTTFAPTINQNFTFQATLDGALYNLVIPWNAYRGGGGQSGWYLNIYDQSGNLVLTTPLVAGVNLISGYFLISTLVFDSVSQAFTVAP